jgi:hypothetical protein
MLSSEKLASEKAAAKSQCKPATRWSPMGSVDQKELEKVRRQYEAASVAYENAAAVIRDRLSAGFVPTADERLAEENAAVMLADVRRKLTELIATIKPLFTTAALIFL